MFRSLFTRLFFILVFAGTGKTVCAQAAGDYKKELDAWHKQRLNKLKAPNGWLNLAGLFWLQPGENRFGHSERNEIVFNHKRMPGIAGRFSWEGKTIRWQTAPGISVTREGEPVREVIVYDSGISVPPVLSLPPFNFTIIKRENKMGVRLRNLEHPMLKAFKGVNRFPADSGWRVSAQLIPPADTNIYITNILGQTTKLSTPGTLEFVLNGTRYTLETLNDNIDELFIVFADATTGKTTYHSGRFLYVKRPAADGLTTIDFNKAINPPCAFTRFATCPLPPAKNRLPLAITAGEKDYHLPD